MHLLKKLACPYGESSLRTLRSRGARLNLLSLLIASQLFQALAAGRNLPLKDFYLRRLVRTLPPYYAILTVYFGLSNFLPHLQPARDSEHLYQLKEAEKVELLRRDSSLKAPKGTPAPAATDS